MKKYFIKSLKLGWREVSKDRFQEYVKTIEQGCMTDVKKCLKEFTKIEER